MNKIIIKIGNKTETFENMQEAIDFIIESLLYNDIPFAVNYEE